MILEIETFVDVFATAGQIFFYDDHIFHNLCDLSFEHDAFVGSFTTKTNQVKQQDVCPMLLAHECCLDLHSSIKESYKLMELRKQLVGLFRIIKPDPLEPF